MIARRLHRVRNADPHRKALGRGSAHDRRAAQRKVRPTTLVVDLPFDGAIAGEAWVDVPREFELALEGVRPNPSVDGMWLAFTLPNPGRARLEVFDVSGRRIGGVEEIDANAGRHIVPVSSHQRLAPGVYLVQLEFAGQRLRTRAVVVE